MSITFDETWADRPVTVDATAGRTFTRTAEAVTTTPATTTAADVINAMGATYSIYIGTPHPEWAWARVTAIGCVPDSDDPSLWRITLTYRDARPVAGTAAGTGGSSPPPPPPPPGTPPEPQDRPPTLTATVRKEAVYFTKDLDGKPLVNVNGDSLEGVPPRYTVRGSLTFTTYPLTFDYAGALLLVGRVNDAVWKGFPAKSLLIDDLSAREKTEHARNFWEVGWVLQHNPDLWTPTKLVNAGRQVRKDPTLPATPDNMLPTLDGSPKPLNADGTQWKTSQPVPPDLEFRFYRTTDFTAQFGA